jgi:hypothetical protein
MSVFVKMIAIESSDLIQRPTHRHMKMLVGMGAVERSHAVDEAPRFRSRVVVRKKFDIDAKFAQVVNDDGVVPEGLIMAPTPEQRGLARSEKAAEDRYG